LEEHKIFSGYPTFKSDVTSDKGAEHLACPSTRKTDENVDRAKESVIKTKIISFCEVANMLGISFGSVQGLLKDNLDISQTATKFVLHLLSDE
jgi:hypothetical protein